MEPCEPEESTYAKAFLEDGSTLWLQAKRPAGAMDELALDFDPNEPRGQPENAGEWVKGGSEASQKPLEGSAGGHWAQVSPRKITALGTTAEQKADLAVRKTKYLPLGLGALREDPKILKQQVSLFRDPRFYPYFTKKQLAGSDEKAAKAIVDQMASNLEFLAGLVPKATATKWAGWYEGAHKIAQRFAQRYGIDEVSASGVIASLSPQKDWNMNVYLAGVVMDAMHNHAHDAWSPEMDAAASRIWRGDTNTAMLALVRGKRLDELDNSAAKGVWIRTFNEAHDLARAYGLVASTGEIGKPMTTAKGAPATATWGSIAAIANAVECFESHGDPRAISEALGDRHKVRSFYNNILDPSSPNGDVTIDTHAVGAALLFPSTGSSIPVYHDLKTNPLKEEKPEGFVGASGSGMLGIQGTYPLYVEAFRQAAAKLGWQPRQLHSVVWEIKQRLFSNTATGANIQTAVDAVWRQYQKGKMSLAQAQDQVVRVTSSEMDPETRDPNILWRTA